MNYQDSPQRQYSLLNTNVTLLPTRLSLSQAPAPGLKRGSHSVSSSLTRSKANLLSCCWNKQPSQARTAHSSTPPKMHALLLPLLHSLPRDLSLSFPETAQQQPDAGSAIHSSGTPPAAAPKSPLSTKWIPLAPASRRLYLLDWCLSWAVAISSELDLLHCPELSKGTDLHVQSRSRGHSLLILHNTASPQPVPSQNTTLCSSNPAPQHCPGA